MAKRSAEPPLPRIHTVRRQKVVVDADLAKLYGVPTKRLNEAVRRNAGRFPSDFCFVLTEDEAANLRSQFATSSPRGGEGLKSQNATSSSVREKHLRPQNGLREKAEHGGRRYLPRVFTEHGALMAANVLRSEKAVQMSLYLVRAFVSMREQLASNLSVLRRLAEIDRKLIEHDVVLREVLARLQPLLDAPDDEEKVKPKIGFHKGNR